jgi:insulysin
MLFLGTRKFPDEKEYKRFITSSGGSCNASTSMENTSYHFEVGSLHLEGALDRFSQFFISPLFEESATNRELEAIHSEYSKNLQLDARRAFQLNKSLANVDHNFHKFSTGEEIYSFSKLNSRD